MALVWLASHQLAVSLVLQGVAEVPGLVSKTKNEINVQRREKLYQMGMDELKKGNCDLGMTYLLKSAQMGHKPSLDALKYQKVFGNKLFDMPRLALPSTSTAKEDDDEPDTSDSQSDDDEEDDYPDRPRKKGTSKRTNLESNVDTLLSLGYGPDAILHALLHSGVNIHTAQNALLKCQKKPSGKAIAFLEDADTPRFGPGYGGMWAPRVHQDDRMMCVPPSGMTGPRGWMDNGMMRVPPSAPSGMYGGPRYVSDYGERGYYPCHPFIPEREYEPRFSGSYDREYHSSARREMEYLEPFRGVSTKFVPGVDENSVRKLMNFGFPRQRCVDALIRARGDQSIATSILYESRI